MADSGKIIKIEGRCLIMDRSKLITSLLISSLLTTSSAFANGFGALPTFKCTLTDKLDKYNWPGVQREQFKTYTPKIYFICDSDTTMTGDSIKAVWIADHISNTKPAIHTMGIMTKHVVMRQSRGESFEADLSLEKPEGGWPLGAYHVQLYINGIPGYTYKFIIR
jgi:hypothetical protein